MTYRAMAVAAVVLAAGCATYEVRPAASASASTTSICVARLDDDGTPSAIPVRDDGVLVGAVTRGSHFCFPASHGRHVVTSELVVVAELAVDVREGATSWVLLEADMTVKNAGSASRGYRSGRSPESLALRRADANEGEKLRASTVQVELVRP